MTFIVAYAHTNIQFLVADRLISKAGQPINDWAKKNVQYWNSHQGYNFLIAYTGVAEWSNWKCAEWLIDILPETFRKDLSIDDGIKKFLGQCDRLMNTFSGLSQRFRGLTFVVCGRQELIDTQSGKIKRIPFVVVVSNCIDEFGNQTNDVSNKFRSWITKISRSKDYIFLCRGDLRAFSSYSKLFIQTSRLVRKLVSLETKIHVVRDFIWHVADITEKEMRAKTIGKNLLGSVLLVSGNTEGFDFPEDASIKIKTMPSLINSDGSKLVDFQVIPNDFQEIKKTSNNLLTSDLERYLILSSWTGSGNSIGDPRRAEINDYYKLLSCSDATGANSWGVKEECPYYGLAVSCSIEDNIIAQVQRDTRYFILISDKSDYERNTSGKWLDGLLDWFAERGMSKDDVMQKRLAWENKKIGTVIQEIVDLLKSSKTG